MHKKTTNWSILVVVVKWRHRAIVLILRLLAKDRGNTLRKKKQFKCTQMNIKGLYAETHYGLLFFSVKPLSPHPTHEKASCETLYHMSIWWQSYRIKRGCARSMDLPWSPERGKIRSRWNRRLSFFWKDANKISHDFAKKILGPDLYFCHISWRSFLPRCPRDIFHMWFFSWLLTSEQFCLIWIMTGQILLFSLNSPYSKSDWFLRLSANVLHSLSQ